MTICLRRTGVISAAIVAVVGFAGVPGWAATPIDFAGARSAFTSSRLLAAVRLRLVAPRVRSSQPCSPTSGSGNGGCSSTSTSGNGGGVSSNEPSGQSSGAGSSSNGPSPTTGSGKGGGVGSNEPSGQSSGASSGGSIGPTLTTGSGKGSVGSNEPAGQSSGASSGGSSDSSSGLTTDSGSGAGTGATTPVGRPSVLVQTLQCATTQNKDELPPANPCASARAAGHHTTQSVGRTTRQSRD
jgi:hypothetical protein